MKYRIGSLCSGVGGLDLAALRLFPGSRVAWHCEYDEAPAKILAYHWPSVPNYRDMTVLDWVTLPPVEIVTAGYPCQPFSQAGRRQGVNDERHLWPFVREAIRHLRPRFTLLENVAGHRTLGFDRVLGDLAEDGLDVRWTSLRASDVGAPHHRERLFILVSAPDADVRRRTGVEERDGGSVEPQLEASLGRDAQRRDADDADADGATGAEQGSLAPGQTEGAEPEAIGGARRGDSASDQGQPDIDWGPFRAAVQRWEALTRPASIPTELGRNGKPRLAPAFAEWMMGLPEGWVTDPAIGVSRLQQLKAIGNGVCPQQAVAAFAPLLEGLVA